MVCVVFWISCYIFPNYILVGSTQCSVIRVNMLRAFLREFTSEFIYLQLLW